MISFFHTVPGPEFSQSWSFSRGMFCHRGDFNFITISRYHELTMGCTIVRSKLHSRARKRSNVRWRRNSTVATLCFDNGIK